MLILTGFLSANLFTYCHPSSSGKPGNEEDELIKLKRWIIKARQHLSQTLQEPTLDNTE
jgi:hypothetical protein